ncbi:MAG: DHA2 family efflux MFS transporter permease subunit [Thermoactinomyces sp.]
MANANTEKRENRGLILTVLLIAVFMAVLDTSIVNVSLPKMMQVFGVSTDEIQWVVTAYSLVVGTIIPITGYLTERFGYKRIFMIALFLFTLGSLLCGLAWSNAVMVLFRIIQAIGGGALMPVAQAMIFRMFAREKRGQAMGMFGIAIMFAPAIGPTLSGYITEYLNWRLIFFINVPIGLVALFLATAAMREMEHYTEQKFDFWGFITSTVGFSTLLYGIGNVADKGWTNTEVLSFIGVGAVSLLAFTIIEWNKKEPMLQIRVVKHGVFSLTQIILSIASVILFVPLFLFPIFLENIMGLSAVQTGLLLLPQALVTGMMMPIAGTLYDRIGARWLAVAGFAVTAFSMYLTTFLDVNTPFSTIILWLALRGFGISLVMMPITTAGLNAVPNQLVNQATALSSTIRQVAMSFGTAWATLLYSHRIAFHVADNSDQINLFSPTSQMAFNQIQQQFMAMGQTMTEAKQSAISYIMGQIQIHSMVQGMSDVFYVTVWLAVAALLLALFITEKRQNRSLRDEPSLSETG